MYKSKFFQALLITFSMFLFATNLEAKSCWNEYEAAMLEHHENDGYMSFSFKDAIDCKPIINADVKILDKVFKTDINGMIKFDSELVDFIEDDFIDVWVNKAGYILYEHRINFTMGTIFHKTFLLSRKLTMDKVRFVLSWSNKPRDLDLHLRGSDFHVSYRHTRDIPNEVLLDRDAMYGFGPETITLDRIESNKKYDLYVHRYSKDAIFKHAIVEVYKRNKIDKSINIPKVYADCFHVLEIKNGFIKYVLESVEEKFCE